MLYFSNRQTHTYCIRQRFRWHINLDEGINDENANACRTAYVTEGEIRISTKLPWWNAVFLVQFLSTSLQSRLRLVSKSRCDQLGGSVSPASQGFRLDETAEGNALLIAKANCQVSRFFSSLTNNFWEENTFARHLSKKWQQITCRSLWHFVGRPGYMRLLQLSRATFGIECRCERFDRMVALNLLCKLGPQGMLWRRNDQDLFHL